MRTTNRKTTREPRRFGEGILPRGRWSGSYGFIPSDDDKAAAVAMFNGDGPEPDWDMLAGEAAYVDSVGRLTRFPAGICENCGQPIDGTGEIKMCNGCEDAATYASERPYSGMMFQGRMF